MSRATQIDEIIQKRLPVVLKLEAISSNLKVLSDSIHTLESYRNQLLTQIADLDIQSALQSVNLTNIQVEVQAEERAVHKLIARFSRQTLNIGVVGRAGQGKSRLLQTLTGLTSDEIPDGKLNNCTGVRSTIMHAPGVESYGEVWFHNEHTFLNDVIYPYYDQLQLGVKPTTVREFGNSPLPPLPTKFASLAEPGSMYEKLVKANRNLHKYQRFLTSSSPLIIRKDEIREFVSQTNPDGNPIFFNYLAVREVDIFCTFLKPDIGKIALIDLPGLGDTALGDKERLKKTIGQDADFVVFVYMPQIGKRIWEDTDVQLYDTTRLALEELPIEQWSFMLLNHTSPSHEFGDNLGFCNEAARTMQEKCVKVAQCLITNCNDSEETEEFFDLALQYLEKNITSLDENYLSIHIKNIEQIQNAISSELLKSRSDLGNVNNDQFREFMPLFNGFWKKITTGLSELLTELSSSRDDDDMGFQNRARDIIKKCLDNPHIPGDPVDGIDIFLDSSNEESRKMIEKYNSYVGSYAKVYTEFMDRLRTYISRQFLSLDDGLKYSVERMKNKVANALINQCGLGGLSTECGSDFLAIVAEQIPNNPQTLKLKQGFEILVNFDLSYRSLIQHRIRQHLDELTPNKNPDLPFDATLSSEQIQINILDSLEVFYKSVLRKCENDLYSLSSEPNQSAFAIVEEFVDQVLRSNNCQDEWRIFLMEKRYEVWKDNFDEMGKKTQILQEWITLIGNVSKANSFSLK
jgi:energy-coupling factor transporter ATP-binding protein EcfA2